MIFQVQNYISALKLSCQSIKKILNTNAKFIYDTGAYLKTRVGSLILRTTHDNYIEKISAIQHDVIGSFDLTVAAAIDYDRSPLFFEVLRKIYRQKSNLCKENSIRIAVLFLLLQHSVDLWQYLSLGQVRMWKHRI